MHEPVIVVRYTRESHIGGTPADTAAFLAPVGRGWYALFMVFSERKVIHYTQGDCWALAIAVSEMTGLPLLGVGYNDERGFPSSDRYWCHVVVGLGDGTVLDVRGVRDPEEVFEEFTNFGGELFPMVKSDLQDAVEEVGTHGFIHTDSWETVQSDAEKLVAAYLRAPA